MTDFYHAPVMLEEVMAGLDLKRDGVYFDGTAGGGGHSSEILKREPTARLIATDKDGEAIAAAGERLSPYAGRFSLHRTDFKNFEEVLDEEGVDKLDGFLLDLGVSSRQLDAGPRGFSYLKREAPLDMRMDTRAAFSAADVVNGYAEEDLKRLLRDYGEERNAARIARKIVETRAERPLTTCGELADIVESCYPARYRSPACARQAFQAVRIEVNGELNGLAECVRKLLRRLRPGGRGCVLTFHSLEDRCVKNVFRDMSTACTCPPNFPVCVCGRKKEIEEITHKPLTATEEEMNANPRSKCAKLRIARKI